MTEAKSFEAAIVHSVTVTLNEGVEAAQVEVSCQRRLRRKPMAESESYSGDSKSLTEEQAVERGSIA
jgi:hypothetical protein